VPESAKPQFVYAAKYLFEHSVHYIHDEWPCDLDIHFNFPGFFAPDDVVFDALWERRATVEVAHWPVPCADFLGQACIVGLHALRDPGLAKSETDLDHLTATLSALAAAQLESMAALAAETGCAATLAPLLSRIGVSIVDATRTNPESLRSWSVRTSTGQSAVPWVTELRESPWGTKPLVVWRAVFLPSDALLSRHVGLPPTRRNIARLHTARWLRALRKVPRALVETRRNGGVVS
jgi:hypothetical protein